MLRRTSGVRRWVQFHLHPPARISAFALATLLASSLLGCHTETPEEIDWLLLTGLQRRLGLVARFTGSGDLPPCALRTASPVVLCAEHDELSGNEIKEIVGRLQRTSPERLPHPSALRREALWGLLKRSDSRARERAVAQLTLALEMEPGSPARQNDLAAVLLLRGDLDHRPADLVEALDLADRAAESGLVEALFNRALALELLTLPSQAKSDWMRLGSKPGRASRLARFARAAVSSVARHSQIPRDRSAPPDAQGIRRQGERLLGAWGSAILAGRAHAAAVSLKEAASIAGRHAAVSGDRVLLAAVESIRRAGVTGGSRLVHLARGHAAYQAARGDGLYASCGPQLDAAEHELSVSATPFVGWAQVDQAVCAYYRKDYPSAIRHLKSALAIAGPDSHFPTLSGRTHWILGLIHTMQGEFSQAELELSVASAELSRAAEFAHVTYLQTLRAKALESGGRPAEAWHRRMAGLAGRSQVAPQRTLSILEEAVQSLRARQLSRAASHFIGEQVLVAEASLVATRAEADFLAFILLQRAAILRDEGAVERARKDLDSADRLVRELAPDTETRQRLELELDVQRAMFRPERATEALSALDRAIAFFRGDSKEADQLEVLRLVRLRAKVLRDAGAFAEAETDLRRGLDELERQRRGLQANDQRARFDAQMRGFQEDLLALLLDRGRTSAALELVESFSNRWWVESDLGNRRRPAPFATPTIPPDTLVLRYAYLSGRLVIWMLQKEGVEVVQLPASERRLWLTARMCRERDMVSRGRERPFCDLTAAQLLPARVWALPLDARLVIVADHVSQEVPFAALRLHPSGPYLVERLRLALAPSVLHMVIDRAKETGSGHAVFVADPALDRRFHPTLEQLYGAREAAAAYARAYGAPVVLDGPAATRKAVLSAMVTAELVHFEAHGFSVPGAPEAGGVVLAADASAFSDQGVLTAEDIYRKQFRNLRLAVLAACQTSPRPYEDSVQLAGLATALIAAGATEVVTAAWDIDNATAIRFFTAFHDCYSRDRTGDDCLRNAQLGFLRSADSSLSDPRAWAPYQIYVGTWNRPRASVSSTEGERPNESATRRLARAAAPSR